MSTLGAEPLDDNGKSLVGYDATNHASAVPQILTTSVDSVTGARYGTMAVTATFPTDQGVNLDKVGNALITLGQNTMANSLPVTIANNQGAIGSAVIQAVAGTALAADQTNSELRTSLYGKNSTAGDTPILVDSGGRQYVIQTIGGNILSATNAEPNISNIQQFILNGTSWSASTGIVSAVASQAGQWFVTSGNTKNILIYSVRLTYTNANQYAQFQYITASDAVITGAGTTSVSSALNLKGGGAAPASTWSMNYNAAGTATGNPLDFLSLALNQTVEFVTPGT